MLITVQYPFADLRPFLSSNGSRLGRPSWPAAQVSNEFIRYFGGIKRRFRGGLAGWVGEGLHCDAAGSLRFESGEPAALRGEDLGLTKGAKIPVRIAFRRLYADGIALAKAEIGFAIPKRVARHIRSENIQSILSHIVALRVRVGRGEQSELVTIATAGAPLAASYNSATTRSVTATQNVFAGRPILFLETGEPLRIPPPFRPVSIERLARLYYADLPFSTGAPLPTWCLTCVGPAHFSWASSAERSLRICLLRLHAECECLRIVLRHIANQDVRPQRYSYESELLQEYCNETTKRIQGLSKRADTMSQSDLAELARSAIDSIFPSERDEIIASLRRLELRRNIFHKVESFVGQQIHFSMNTYNITGGQIGAVGTGAVAQNNTFNQLIQDLDSAKLSTLAEELATLRTTLKARANAPEQDMAVGAIAEAEAAARAGDKSKATSALAKAGKWCLDVAKEIAVPVTQKLLSAALGHPG